MNALDRLRWRVGKAREKVLRSLDPGRMRVMAAAWPLAPECLCDVDFADYLVGRGVRGASIFHFGSGGHHLVGRRNLDDGLENEIWSITNSPDEQAAYVAAVVRRPALGRRYRVLFGDIYELSAAALPAFDLVTLFHLSEYTPRGGADHRLDDAGLLALFCGKLNGGGRLLLYEGSFARPAAAALAEQAVALGVLTFEERWRSLLVYRV
jgi:hypothetical protein